MRRYYIYKQQAKIVNTHIETFIYKWLPFEYVGYVDGTKELFNIFGRRIYKYYFHDSFTYDFNTFEKRAYPFSMPKEYKPTERFLIMDDGGNIRDFYELTQRHKKKYRYQSRHQAYQYHYARNIQEQRCSVTPDEIKECKELYGITLLPLKPKRYYDSLDLCGSKTISKGWKTQSKRKRQYKGSR